MKQIKLLFAILAIVFATVTFTACKNCDKKDCDKKEQCDKKDKCCADEKCCDNCSDECTTENPCCDKCAKVSCDKEEKACCAKDSSKTSENKIATDSIKM